MAPQLTPHPNDDEIREWVEGTMPDALRERMVGHIAACAECAARLARHVVEPTDVAAFQARGREVFRPAGGLSWIARHGLPVAAGLLLAVAAGTGVWKLARPSAPGAPSSEVSGIRGDEILLVAPAGATVLPARFTWRSPVTATTFLVEVFDARGTRVFQTVVATEGLAPTQSLQDVLGARDQFEWQVTARGSDGGILLRSRRQSFTVTR